VFRLKPEGKTQKTVTTQGRSKRFTCFARLLPGPETGEAFTKSVNAIAPTEPDKITFGLSFSLQSSAYYPEYYPEFSDR
jgi:hypothetical protein